MQTDRKSEKERENLIYSKNHAFCRRTRDDLNSLKLSLVNVPFFRRLRSFSRRRPLDLPTKSRRDFSYVSSAMSEKS